MTRGAAGSASGEGSEHDGTLGRPNAYDMVRALMAATCIASADLVILCRGYTTSASALQIWPSLSSIDYISPPRYPDTPTNLLLTTLFDLNSSNPPYESLAHDLRYPHSHTHHHLTHSLFYRQHHPSHPSAFYLAFYLVFFCTLFSRLDIYRRE